MRAVLCQGMSSFVFRGGHPALDFVNTEIVSEGERRDLLETWGDVSAWMKEAGLAADPRRGVLQEVKAFRGALRALVTRLARGGKARPRDLRFLNDALARGRGSFRLRLERGVLRSAFRSDSDDALAILAGAAADLLAHHDPALIRQCQGSGCILFFYDATKSHTRRWCSMAACGNRFKAAQHYARSRGAR